MRNRLWTIILYTTEEVAKRLKVSKLTVYDLIKKGELPSYRVGRQMRIDAAGFRTIYKANENREGAIYFCKEGRN